MRNRKLRIFAIFMLLLGTSAYFYLFHRVERTQAAQGWRLRFSYQPFHCQVCLGRVEELTYHGMHVAVPSWAWNSNGEETPCALIQTPVGVYQAWKGEPIWRLGHAAAVMIQESEKPISAEELKQGWCDAQIVVKNFCYGPFLRRKNIPAEWCLIYTTNAARWIAPDRIGTVKW